MKTEREFYKDDENSRIWLVDEHESDKADDFGIIEQDIGKYLFSFDKKQVFNFWTDYPDKLTPEQVEIFKKENPTMAALK